MPNPLLETTTHLEQLLGSELDKATDAVRYLLTDRIRGHIKDASLLAKLASLRDDLEAEQEERRNIAKH